MRKNLLLAALLALSLLTGLVGTAAAATGLSQNLSLNGPEDLGDVGLRR